MLIVLKKLLFGNGENIMRKSAVWNLISSLEYSLQSAVLMLVVTRVSGLYVAGVFTICYTLTQMMSTIGNYGMRSFQVSDIKREYSFQTYFSSRIVSTLIMIIICMSFAVFQGYDSEKMLIIIALCGYRMVDSMEDVFHGEMQKSLRFDVASKIMSARIFIATLAFSISHIITKDLFFSSMVLAISAVIVSVILNWIAIVEFEEIYLKVKITGIMKLLLVCLPVCLGEFLYNYLINAPKYAIDRNLSEETQTIFSILFMPIFAINMLSSFIFKPMIVNMGVLWNDGEYKKFIMCVLKQMITIIVLTIVLMLAGAIVGIDIMGWMYNVDLDIYRVLFAVLILFGGVAAMVAFLVVVLTIIRKQEYIMISYGIALVLTLLFIDTIVIKYKIWGAGIAYGLSMSIVMLLLLAVLVTTMYKKRMVK